MARLIVKSPYIKGGSAGGYLKYIGSREGVELLPPGYMEYMAERPRSHGLFGDEDSVDLDAAVDELQNYTGNIWTHIISLRREDAARLGYDNAAAWRNLIRAHRNDIAAAMKIPPNDFRWYAAFHDEGEHPHIHMMAWSADPKYGYLSKEGIRQIKSKLTNDIFRNEMLHLYEQKSESRDELVREARLAMLKLVRSMQEGVCDHPDAEQLIMELAARLDTVRGKKSYGYLPKPLKSLVDEIVDEMERLPAVRDCYEQWLVLQGKVDSYYHDEQRERIPLSQQKEFRQIKNAVIREAEGLRLGEVTFEEKDFSQHDEPEEFQNVSYNYWTLRDIIRDDDIPMEDRMDAVKEMNQMAESGDMYAQHLMGKLWRDGPLLIPDSVNARYWFEQAARQGHLVAQYSLAKLYLSDDLEVCNTKLGMEWLNIAAEGGNRYAMYRLAKEYLKGEFIDRDPVQAVEWFTKSAERGNPYAQYMLGKMYLTGKEVAHDEEKAVYWLTQSAEQGNEYAQFLLDHQEENRPPSAMLAVTRLLHHMSRIFRDNSVPKSRPGGIQIDRKRLKKLQEKRIAMGHKADDHEEQWPDMIM
ncbi:MobP3 family relaxase [uncultured Dysosmobacter sp.]|uniref:MobP3 family relaxase n=1 Tax=uncultured Dysosmobacter sp. TaxID=2591384 RepID=UPI00260485D2|nr:MobP3 family relaxase [uncultured Dysosmobacter sp.]